jgi:very-short-patch-repair endonuclease
MNGWPALAERQYGVISRSQLRQAGVTERQIHALLASSRVERVHSGIYRVVGSYKSARQGAIAATLWCGEGALLSHATAAQLLRLPARRDESLHVTVAPSVRRSAPDLVLHRSDLVEPRDRFEVDALPCTSPTRTLIDLAATLDGESLEHAFEVARRYGLTTKTVLARRAETMCGPGRPGSAAIRSLLRVVESRPKESKLEVRLARLLRKHDLRPDVIQHPVERFRLDFAWLRRLFAVEADGFEWHGNRLAWKRDRRRIARLEALGWSIVHVTWEDVTDRPEETVDRIRRALARAAA